MATFGERLSMLRKERDKTLRQLAKELNHGNSTISNWEKDNRFPDRDTLIKLANYFNVSIDFLLGASDIRKPCGDDAQKLDKALELRDELLRLMIQRGIIKNKDELNEEHLNLIELAINTYKNKQ